MIYHFSIEIVMCTTATVKGCVMLICKDQKLHVILRLIVINTIKVYHLNLFLGPVSLNI